LGKLDHHATLLELGNALTCAAHDPRGPLALPGQEWLALDLSRETRGALIERRQSLHLSPQLGVTPGIIARGNRRQLARHRCVALLLGDEVPQQLRELLYRELHLRELALE